MFACEDWKKRKEDIYAAKFVQVQCNITLKELPRPNQKGNPRASTSSEVDAQTKLNERCNRGLDECVFTYFKIFSRTLWMSPSTTFEFEGSFSWWLDDLQGLMRSIPSEHKFTGTFTGIPIKRRRTSLLPKAAALLYGCKSVTSVWPPGLGIHTSWIVTKLETVNRERRSHRDANSILEFKEAETSMKSGCSRSMVSLIHTWYETIDPEHPANNDVWSAIEIIIGIQIAFYFSISN